MSRARTLLVACFCAFFVSCLDDWDLEARTFPCREPADCVEGYFCHPSRFVCVSIGTSTVSDAATIAGDADLLDAEVLDAAGTEDAGGGGRISDPCNAGAPCAEGECVDGYCCDDPCDGVCARCDAEPGHCTAIDGPDSSGGCGGDVACGDFVFGLIANACHAYATGGGRRTCDDGVCSVTGCEALGAGAAIAQCGSSACLRANVCPRNAARSAFDEVSELCAEGLTCGEGPAGCCSATGRCCPTPACSDEDPQCF